MKKMKLFFTRVACISLFMLMMLFLTIALYGEGGDGGGLQFIGRPISFLCAVAAGYYGVRLAKKSWDIFK